MYILVCTHGVVNLLLFTKKMGLSYLNTNNSRYPLNFSIIWDVLKQKCPSVKHVRGLVSANAETNHNLVMTKILTTIQHISK